MRCRRSAARTLPVGRQVDGNIARRRGKIADGGDDAGRFGPDNNSGTISTISTTKIVAPTRRSLTDVPWESYYSKSTRRRQYIREGYPVAACRAPRANPSPDPPCGRSRTRRYGPEGPRPPMPPLAGGGDVAGPIERGSNLRRYPRRQLRAARAARAVRRGQPPRVDAVAQLCRNARGVLVGEHAADGERSACGRQRRANCVRARQPHRDCVQHPISRWAGRLAPVRPLGSAHSAAPTSSPARQLPRGNASAEREPRWPQWRSPHCRFDWRLQRGRRQVRQIPARTTVIASPLRRG